MTKGNLIPFTLTEPRYDQETYMGRWWSIFEASNVRYAFKTDSEVLRQQALVTAQKEREAKAMQETGSPKVMLTEEEIEELRHALNITKAAIHPDTNMPIPIPLRMTFFVPSNIPIAMGMVFSPPTVFYTVFWQIIN